MKLEVGMYVRTKGGFIDKIISFKSTISNDYVELEDEYYANKKDILKASNNIIDLIEVGDIIKLDITDTDNYAEIQGYNCWEISCAEELNGVKEMIAMESAKLISIVTKEQFESMSYKVGD